MCAVYGTHGRTTHVCTEKNLFRVHAEDGIMSMSMSIGYERYYWQTLRLKGRVGDGLSMKGSLCCGVGVGLWMR